MMGSAREIPKDLVVLDTINPPLFESAAAVVVDQGGGGTHTCPYRMGWWGSQGLEIIFKNLKL